MTGESSAPNLEAPESRVANLRLLIPLASAGLVIAAVGVWMALVGDTVENKGRFAGIPESWNPLIGIVVIVIGIAGVGIAGSAAIRFRHSPEIVRFEPNRLVIRRPLRQAEESVDRGAVRRVQVMPSDRLQRAIGFRPVVRIHVQGGSSTAIPPFYEGDPEHLAGDIARWSGVPSRLAETDRR